MADPPPKPPHGSLEWVQAEVEAIAKLSADERWPSNLDPPADSGSGNNRRHEEWLDHQEWPSPQNDWISHKGHPLTPGVDDPRRVQWTEIYTLDRLVADKEGVRMGVDQTSTCAFDGREVDGNPAPERTTHLLGQPMPSRPRHVIFGGACESLDLEYDRLAPAQRLVHEVHPQVIDSAPAVGRIRHVTSSSTFSHQDRAAYGLMQDRRRNVGILHI